MDVPLVYGCVTSSLHIITLIFILDYYAHNFTLLRPVGNQIRVVAFQPAHLAQGQFLPKNQNAIFFISFM